MELSQRRRWFQRGWLSSKIGITAVLGIFLVSAAANFEAGQALSGDVLTSLILGLASVCVDLAKASMVFAVAWAATNRRWAAMTAALLMFVLCLTWSLRSATQFMWSTMSQHAAETHLAADIAKSEADLLAVKTQRAGFLSQQSIKVGGRNTRSARIDAIGENRRTAGEFNSLIRDIEAQQQKMKQSKPTVAEDPLASVLKLDSKTVYTLSALIFALILEIVSSMGFWVIAQARQPRLLPEPPPSPMVMLPEPEPEPALTPPMPEVIKADNVVAFKPRLVEKVVAAPAPEIPVAQAEAVSPAIDEIQLIVRGLFEAMPGERWLYKSVVDLINANLPIERQIMLPYLYAQVVLPAIVAELPGVTKGKTGGRVYLYGLRPRSLDAREATQ